MEEITLVVSFIICSLQKLCIRVMNGKPGGKRPFRRTRHSWGIILKWILNGMSGSSLDSLP
jgi:hypothetical protein